MVDVPPQHHAAFPRRERPIQRREVRCPALEIVVEVDQTGEDALTRGEVGALVPLQAKKRQSEAAETGRAESDRAHLVKVVGVQGEVLAGMVADELQALAVRPRQAGEGGGALLDRDQRRVERRLPAQERPVHGRDQCVKLPERRSSGLLRSSEQSSPRAQATAVVRCLRP